MAQQSLARIQNYLIMFNKVWVIFLLLGTAVFVAPAAAEIEAKSKELTRLQLKIKQISSNISSLKTQENTLLGELKKLDIRYGKSASYLHELTRQITTINSELQQNQQQINTKYSQINAQKSSLNKQLKIAHRMGRNDQLKLLLNLQDTAVFGRIMTYYDYLNKARLEKIASINVGLQQLQALKTEQRSNRALLAKKAEKKQAEQSALNKTKAERKKLLATIKQQFTAKKQQLTRFKNREQRLKELLTNLQRAVDDSQLARNFGKQFAALKGRLAWPVSGKIVKKFGSNRSASRWDGVLIKARSGTTIKAVSSGRVVYADWLRGYGLLTIIDHGKGYMTLYAFSQSLYKSVGDKVAAGAVIATIGQSGGQPAAGLYFGIRKKGKPVNPEKWCRKIG